MTLLLSLYRGDFMKNRLFYSILIITLCFCLFSGCTSAVPASSATAAATEGTAAFDPSQDWAPTLKVERFSQNGAMILFENTDIPGDYLLLAGNDYVLQVSKDGTWQDLPIKKDSVTWVTDAFVLSAVPRDDIDWEWLYGNLPAGHYRIGKNVALCKNDQILDRSTVYAEFVLEAAESPAEDTYDMASSTAEYDFRTYEYPSLSLATSYTYTEALANNVVILDNGSAIENQDVWYHFAHASSSGLPATVRCIQLGDDYGFPAVYDVTYDGMYYTIRWFEDGAEKSFSYKNMVQYLENPDHNTLVRYVLVMDRNSTWEDIEWGMVSQNDLYRVPHHVVFQVLRYIPSHPPIPEGSNIVLTMRGNPVFRADEAQAQQLTDLFSEAQYMSEAPESSYNGLDLTFTDADGKTITLWLCPNADHFLYNGSFYSYSSARFLDTCGLSQWPE